MWYQDHMGWPITARPFASIGTQERVDVSEVLNQIVRRACLFKPVEDKTEKPTDQASRFTTVSSTTTVNHSLKSTVKDDVLVEPVEASRPLDLVSCS